MEEGEEEGEEGVDIGRGWWAGMVRVVGWGW